MRQSVKHHTLHITETEEMLHLKSSQRAIAIPEVGVVGGGHGAERGHGLDEVAVLVSPPSCESTEELCTQ
jgi:hypothetical protein